jgi:hypothetical protein
MFGPPPTPPGGGPTHFALHINANDLGPVTRGAGDGAETFESFWGERSRLRNVGEFPGITLSQPPAPPET